MRCRDEKTQQICSGFITHSKFMSSCTKRGVIKKPVARHRIITSHNSYDLTTAHYCYQLLCLSLPPPPPPYTPPTDRTCVLNHQHSRPCNPSSVATIVPDICACVSGACVCVCVCVCVCARARVCLSVARIVPAICVCVREGEKKGERVHARETGSEETSRARRHFFKRARGHTHTQRERE